MDKKTRFCPVYKRHPSFGMSSILFALSRSGNMYVAVKEPAQLAEKIVLT